MDVTTMIDATTARIIPHGDIDHTALPKLRAVIDALPRDVTELVWDLDNTPFLDSAGLHLLTDPSPAGTPQRHTKVTGLGPQPRELLRTAEELFPHLELSSLLADARPQAAACGSESWVEDAEGGQVPADRALSTGSSRSFSS